LHKSLKARTNLSALTFHIQLNGLVACSQLLKQLLHTDAERAGSLAAGNPKCKSATEVKMDRNKKGTEHMNMDQNKNKKKGRIQ
jgi:hypothetical protein